MSNSVTVNVEVTENPFGVKGSLKVDDAVFDLNRQQFSDGALAEVDRLGNQLMDLALAEYDRRNAESE